MDEPRRPEWWKRDWTFEGPGGFKEYWDGLSVQERKVKRGELLDYFILLCAYKLDREAEMEELEEGGQDV